MEDEFKIKLKRSCVPTHERLCVVEKNVHKVYPFRIKIIFQFNPENWNFFPKLKIAIGVGIDISLYWVSEYAGYDNVHQANLDRMYHVDCDKTKDMGFSDDGMIEDAVNLENDIKKLMNDIIEHELSLSEIEDQWKFYCEKHNFKENKV